MAEAVVVLCGAATAAVGTEDAVAFDLPAATPPHPTMELKMEAWCSPSGLDRDWRPTSLSKSSDGSGGGSTKSDSAGTGDLR